MFPTAHLDLARAVIDAAKASDTTIVTAESCTGGLIAGALTEIAGSSAVVDRGWVTYSNTAKADALGVPPEMILEHGAVSLEVAAAMVEGALAESAAGLAVSVTGIAGPGGGSPDKPVGLVCFGLATAGGDVTTEEKRFGDLGRTEVRLATVRRALALLRGALG